MASTTGPPPKKEPIEEATLKPQTDAEADQQYDLANPSVESKLEDGAIQPDTYLHGLRLAAVVIGVCLSSLMMSLDVTIIATAIPSITAEFPDSSSQIAWYPAAFTFATCALTPIAGKMAAVFPINRVYLSFMLVFLAGSILCACAPSSSALIAGRAIAGAGSAGVAANGMTILVRVAEPRKKPMFVGLAAACFAVGLVVAPVVGGVFTARLGWRWCFWVNLPVVGVAFGVVALGFRTGRGLLSGTGKGGGGVWERLKRLDLVGCGIFVPAVFMLLFAMEQGGQGYYAWGSARVVGLFVGFAVMAGLFGVWEWRKGDGAMIPAEVVRRRTVLFAVLFAFCHMGSLTIATYYLPQWFQAVEGVDPFQSGIRYLPTVITQIVMTMTASSLALKLKYYNPWFFLAPLFLVASSALFTQLTPFSTPQSRWIGIQVIQGVAGGWGMQMSSLAVQLELKDSPDLLPVGIALVSFLQYLGASVVQVVGGAVFNGGLRQQLTSEAGLTAEQTALLLEAGTTSVRDVAGKSFPELINPILEAYNTAVTRTFFIPMAGGTLAFLLAFGIKWTKIEGVK